VWAPQIVRKVARSHRELMAGTGEERFVQEAHSRLVTANC
jgi:hypothetical protein